MTRPADARPRLESLETRIVADASWGLVRAFGDGGVARGAYTWPAASPARFTPDGGAISAVATTDRLGRPLLLVQKLAATGTADATFGVGGLSATVLPSALTSVRVGAAVAGADGAVYVAGRFADLVTRIAGWSFLAKLTADGVLDRAYAGGGVRVRPGAIQAVAVDAAGRVVVANRSLDGRSLDVQRLRADGRADPAFAAGGVFRYEASPSRTVDAFGLALSPTGGVVVGLARNGAAASDSAAVVVRLTPAGTRDRTFGGTGYVEIDRAARSAAGSVVAQPDGGVLVGLRGGTAPSTPSTLTRLTASGVIDASAARTEPAPVPMNAVLAGPAGVYVVASPPGGALTIRPPDGGPITGPGLVVGATAVELSAVASLGRADGVLCAAFIDAGGRLTVARFARRAPTTAALAASSPSVGRGRPVTLTARTTGIPAGGVVTFRRGAAVLGTAAVNAAGVAALTTTLPVGVHSLGVSYSGDDARTACASAAVTVTVARQVATVTTLTAKAATVAAGSPAVLRARVSPAGGGAMPTGSVTFRAGTTLLGSAAVDARGVATLVVTNIPVGVAVIRAGYSGDRLYLWGHSTPVAVSVVVPAATATVLTASAARVSVNAPVALTAVVTRAGGFGRGGVVTFVDGATILGRANVDGRGVARLSARFKVPGARAVRAFYAYGADKASWSAAAAVTVA